MTTMTEELPEVWSAEELAAAAGVSKTTICRWAAAGELPVIRKLPGVTGVYVFPRHALRAAQDKIELPSV